MNLRCVWTVDTSSAAPGDDDVDVLAEQYISVITSVDGRMVPLKTVICRRRMSDPWLDDECS